MPMEQRRIVFFCSAHAGIAPSFNEGAREAVQAVLRRGFTLVSGGTVKGTMGVIADEAARLGGRHIGVLPRFMEPLAHPRLTETVWTPTMSVRKETMRDGTCAAVALPGGIGTLDEWVETLVLKKLGKYAGAVIALNLEGFYEPLKHLLDHYVRTGMLEPRDRDLALFPEDMTQFDAILEAL